MKEQILIVEDEGELRIVLNEILQSFDYQVLAASGAREAFNILEEGQIPDLIISDIMMPEISGYDFFQEFRRKYFNYNIPFIFLTAKSEDTDVRKGMNLGVEDYLKKPFKASDLIRSIELRLEKKKIVKDKIDLFKKSLSYNIPHELRTPLVPIIGFSELILERGNQFTQEEINSFISSINASGTKLKERIKKLLLYEELELQDITDMRTQHNELNIEVDFDQLNDTLLQLSLKMNRQKDVTIDLEQAKLNIYFPYLLILLTELMENALKYSLPNTAIDVRGRKENDLYTFSIKDNGNGNIDNEMVIPSEKFDQSNEYWKQTGFGIAIVEKILKKYNSKLHIIKNRDRGITTTFSIGLKRSHSINSTFINVAM